MEVQLGGDRFIVQMQSSGLARALAAISSIAGSADEAAAYVEQAQAAADAAAASEAAAIAAAETAGPVATGSIVAPMVSDDSGDLAAILEKLMPTGATVTFDPVDAGGAGLVLSGEATGKAFDVLQVSSVIGSGQTGNNGHFLGTAASGAVGGQAIGAAMEGPGTADAAVGNRYEDGIGNGVTGARVGTGLGNGVEGRCSTTAVGSAGYFIKQNPPSGTAGSGPAVWMLNNSVNGEASYTRSADGNVEATTAITDRMNGTQGTAQFVRVLGAGARTALLRGAATHIVPTGASTGSGAVIGHDCQISAWVSGSADARGINVVNSATGGVDGFGAAVVVDGANTTNYGMYVNAQNGTTNHSLYAVGAISTGGNIHALADGTQDIGAGGARFGTIFAATGTINTSDAREKRWLGVMTEAHLRAARRIGQIMGLYQWLDAVAEKGEDGARIHYGVRAQEVAEIFYDEGLETRPSEGEAPSFRHAILCYDRWDDVYQPDMVKRTIVKKAMEWVDTGNTRTVQGSSYTVKTGKTLKNGKPERKRVTPPPYELPVLERQEVEHVVERYENAGDKKVRDAGDRYGLHMDELVLFLVAAQEVRLAAIEQVVLAV